MRGNLAVFLAVALAALLIVFLKIESDKKHDLNEINNQVELQISDYRYDRLKLTEELNKLEAEHDKNKRGVSSFMLLFSQVDNTFLSEIVPLLNEKNIPGIICITRDNLTNEEDFLSVSDIESLVDSGWQTAMSWDGSEDIEQWFLDMSSFIEEAGISVPKVLYMKSESYDPSIQQTVYDLGFSDVIVKLSSSNQFCESTLEGLSIIDSFGWYTNAGLERLTALAQNGGQLAFVVGNDGQDELYESSQFSAMLKAADSIYKTNMLSYVTASGAKELKKSNQDRYKLFLESYNYEKERLEDAIKELDDKIDSVYSEGEFNK